MKAAQVIPACLLLFTLQRAAGQQAQPVGLNLGNRAPDIELPDPYGGLLSLSELKGKLVLIDFWASWCSPCRRENPSLVAAYSKFKSAKFRNGNGFAIFSVSLDTRREAWLNAIRQDELHWTTHVSDLSGWDSKAATAYRIQSIPSNVLVNAEGIIIARDLHAKELERFLDKLVIKEH